jgi:TonB family protein
MSLLDKLLAKSVQPDSLQRKVIIRVLLDDEGQVQDVLLKRSCGDPAADQRALEEIRNMKFPRGNLGSGPKTSRRWHELAYAADR